MVLLLLFLLFPFVSPQSFAAMRFDLPPGTPFEDLPPIISPSIDAEPGRIRQLVAQPYPPKQQPPVRREVPAAPPPPPPPPPAAPPAPAAPPHKPFTFPPHQPFTLPTLPPHPHFAHLHDLFHPHGPPQPPPPMAFTLPPPPGAPSDSDYLDIAEASKNLAPPPPPPVAPPAPAAQAPAPVSVPLPPGPTNQKFVPIYPNQAAGTPLVSAPQPVPPPPPPAVRPVQQILPQHPQQPPQRVQPMVGPFPQQQQQFQNVQGPNPVFQTQFGPVRQGPPPNQIFRQQPPPLQPRVQQTAQLHSIKPLPHHFENEIVIDAADPTPNGHQQWFHDKFDVSMCRSHLASIERKFRNKFPPNLQRNGKDAQLASVVSERLFECEKKQRAGHWEKVERLIHKIQLSKSEEGECRQGMIQERISCVNLLSFACQFIDPSYQFRLVPARITVNEARQAEAGAEKCRKVVKLVKKRIDTRRQ
ncbi:hypothetical protein PENTCL1PPCAC_11900 [Pristionchus entomophagus]|uniref:Uncharacterized protein n=1 Tax=Pristionchus entomophagus TaxID=358040 RepID=A0AAV5T3S1_9BILA|nr:hypothetical protein PENTCL1PPCAC_11900 [Pristionchus entomophagus]